MHYVSQLSSAIVMPVSWDVLVYGSIYYAKKGNPDLTIVEWRMVGRVQLPINGTMQTSLKWLRFFHITYHVDLFESLYRVWFKIL